MSDDVKSLLSQQEQLEAKRENWSNWWQSIAQRVMPSSATFTTTDTDGTRRNERLFSGRAVTANERFAAVMDDLLTPRSQVWHQLAADNEDLQDSQAVKEYFEAVNKVLFTQRYRPRANFASQKAEGYLSIGAFGNSCMFIDEEVGAGPRYRHVFLKEVFWSENHQGVIDIVNRKFPMNARQAMQCAKQYNWTLPEKIRTAATNDPLKEFDFLHCVRPNEERVQSRKDAKGMAFSSFYIAMEGSVMLGTGGYTTFPYAIGRYMLAPREIYARSPAMACWGAIQTINEQKKTILRAGQKEVDPPLLLSEDGALEPFNLRPGALNHGTLSADGTPLVQPLKIGANIPLGMELMEMEGHEIDDSFLVTLFQVLTENPQMTATQVLEIAQQKAVLLAPIMGRQHSEDLGPLIARELDIAAKNGLLPDMPPELADYGAEYKIEYRSPLARAMRAQDGVAIMRTFEALPAAVSIDPDSAFVLDVQGGLRELAEINGVPAKLIREKKMVDQMVAQRDQQKQVAGMAAMAPEMSQAALNAAKAEQLRTGT